MLICPPTPREAVGNALLTAGHTQAAYQPPYFRGATPSLGGCSAGWVVESVPGDWVLVAFRPEGDQSYAVQRAQLERYQREVFTGARGWSTMWNRRQWPGIAALLVRKAETP